MKIMRQEQKIIKQLSKDISIWQKKYEDLHSSLSEIDYLLYKYEPPIVEDVYEKIKDILSNYFEK